MAEAHRVSDTLLLLLLGVSLPTQAGGAQCNFVTTTSVKNLEIYGVK